MSYLTETKKRNLTTKQQAFLDNIIVTEGDFKKSAELAGYSGNHYQVLKSLKEEIVDLASDVLARSAPKAAFKLIQMVESDRPCLLYTSPSPRDLSTSRMPSSA